MNILVTGGTGFIGKYLVNSLLEKNYTVTIFDNFSNSTKDSLKSLVSKGVKLIDGDITRPSEISNAMINQKIVIHLAAKISVSESIKNPSETFEFPVADVHAYKQLGNSVAVPAIQATAREILKIIR